MTLANVTKKINQNKSNDELDTAQDYVKYFIDKGYTPEQATGIVGSLQQESRLDPNIVNPTSKAYGIGQWLGSRKKDLKKYVDEHGGKLIKRLNLIS